MPHAAVEIKKDSEIAPKVEERKEIEDTVSLFEELFGTKAKVRTFMFLLSHPIFEYTIEDIRRYTGLSRITVMEALKKFKEYGIVAITRRVGRAEFYQIDLSNPIVEAYNEMDRKITKWLISRGM